MSNEKETIIPMESSSSGSKENKKIRKKRLKKHVSTTMITEKQVKKPAFKIKFKPPRKLSAKEIKEAFEKQDSIILDKSANSSDMSKYYRQLINRPTVRQIQKTTPLATLVRTSEGVRVIPTQSKEKEKKKFSLFKNYHSNESINVSIFSNKNAKQFEQYLNSNEKDYKNFSLTSNQGAEMEMQAFEWTICETKISGDMGFVCETMQSTSFASLFQKKESTTPLEHQNTLFNVTLNNSLTPDGFYKRNKADISNIMRKYLTNTQSSTDSRNIFQNDNISNEDLDL